MVDTISVRMCMRCEGLAFLGKVPLDFNGKQIGFLCKTCDEACFIDNEPTLEFEKLKEKILEPEE